MLTLYVGCHISLHLQFIFLFRCFSLIHISSVLSSSTIFSICPFQEGDYLHIWFLEHLFSPSCSLFLSMSPLFPLSDVWQLPLWSSWWLACKDSMASFGYLRCCLTHYCGIVLGSWARAADQLWHLQVGAPTPRWQLQNLDGHGQLSQQVTTFLSDIGLFHHKLPYVPQIKVAPIIVTYQGQKVNLWFSIAAKISMHTNKLLPNQAFPLGKGVVSPKPARPRSVFLWRNHQMYPAHPLCQLHKWLCPCHRQATGHSPCPVHQRDISPPALLLHHAHLHLKQLLWQTQYPHLQPGLPTQNCCIPVCTTGSGHDCGTTTAS